MVERFLVELAKAVVHIWKNLCYEYATTMRQFLIYECSVRLIWPSTLHTIKNNIIEKSVHTSDGVLWKYSWYRQWFYSCKKQYHKQHRIKNSIVSRRAYLDDSILLIYLSKLRQGFYGLKEMSTISSKNSRGSCTWIVTCFWIESVWKVNDVL